MDEFEHLKQSVMFTVEDEEHLQNSGDILASQVDDILDFWYGCVADNEFLVRSWEGDCWSVRAGAVEA